MGNQPTCPDCHAFLSDHLTCQDHFHQLLFWENEVPEYGEVHHLTVLCYHLQHPSLYSPEGLQYARKLLVDFQVRGLSPTEVRRKEKDQVDSGKRQIKITSRPGSQGAYPTPIQWKMTVADVVAAGKAHYPAAVRAWADSILHTLVELPPPE